MMELALSAMLHQEHKGLGKIHRQPLGLCHRRQGMHYPIDSSIYSASIKQNSNKSLPSISARQLGS